MITLRTPVFTSRWSFDNYLIGTTSVNKWIPIVHIFNKHIDYLQNDIYYYRKISAIYSNRITSYAHLIKKLDSTSINSYYTFVFKETDYDIVVGKGYIEDAFGNILLCTCASDFDKNNLKDEITGEIDVSKFRILVAHDLLVDPKYSNVWKHVYDKYVNPLIESGIDMEVLSSETILKKTHSNEFKLDFKSITELQEHLKNDISEIFHLTTQDAREEVEEAINEITQEDNYIIDSDSTSTYNGTTLTTNASTNSVDSVEIRGTTMEGPVAVGHIDITYSEDTDSFETSLDEDTDYIDDDFTSSEVIEDSNGDVDFEQTETEEVDNSEQTEMEEVESEQSDEQVNFQVVDYSTGGVLSVSNLEEFGQLCEHDGDSIVISVMYNADNTISVVYVGGFINNLTEEQVLEAISMDSNVNEVAFNDNPYTTYVSAYGFSWNYLSQADSLVPVDILCNFVDWLYIAREESVILSVVQLRSGIFTVTYEDVLDTELFTEEDVYNLPTAPTVELIDDIE